MNGAALAKRVDAVIARVGGMDRKVYLRTQSAPIGDSLIGRDTSTTTDILITPQPVYKKLGKRDLIYLSTQGKQVSGDDYMLTISPLSVTEDQLSDQSAEFVLKDAVGAEEVLRVIYVDNQAFQGETVLLTCIGRSVSHNV
jgi:hypothetical protein